jgi:serine/threonine-protein kinase
LADKEALVLPGPSKGDASIAGARFDDFELLEQIGRGGMGIVYKARQLSLDRFVAVKLLLDDQFQNSVQLDRFLGEARALAALDHPEIVKIYQIGHCEYGHYFAMDYVEGKSLEEMIAKGPLPIMATAALMTRLARAIHYAHGKGVIHRDLKPANILLKDMRRPVVMDFGLAKVAGKSANLTEQGMVLGTPAFMSPEQASDTGEPVGPHSDIYSLGAILYAALVGRPPFAEKTVLSTIMKVLSSEAPTSPRTLRPEIPAGLEKACLKALAKAPADRYPTALAFGEDLLPFAVSTASVRKKASLTSEAPAEKPTAVVLVAQKTGEQLRLNDLATVVGRAPECDRVLQFADVSKRHCQILVEKGQVIVEDLSSANGTFVNRKKIKRVVLKDGDILRISSHRFQVRLLTAESES